MSFDKYQPSNLNNLVLQGLFLCSLLSTNSLHASDGYDPIPLPEPGEQLINGEGALSVDEVNGKEYSHAMDHDEGAVLDPEQVVLWDGDETVSGNSGTENGYDYTGGRPGIPMFGIPMIDEDRQIDAISHSQDFLFDELINNEASLLFSIEGDSLARVFYKDPMGDIDIWAELESSGAGINHHNPITDLDGLEVWGPVGDSDATRYSHEDDSATGTSVWAYDNEISGESIAYLSHLDVANAVADLFDIVNPDMDFLNAVDIDALMTSDEGEIDSIFDIGDRVLFSINPIDGIADGGELILLTHLGGSNIMASFLNHGGQVWNTGSGQNVDAIEAVFTADGEPRTGGFEGNGPPAFPVPEPGTYFLLGAMLAVVGFTKNRKHAVKN